MVQVENGTVLDDQGLIVAFGYDKFVSDICLGDGCLICGASPTEKEFNDEHVLPKWLLKHAGLFDQFITLPNTTKIKYGQYTLPCCADCNSFYGKNLEEKVRPLITGGYSNFKNVITEETAEVVYIWLAFVFFKTHLKDTLLRLYQDRRKGDEVIASKYNWAWLHHIHAVIRSVYTGAKLEKGCIGTFVALHADPGDLATPFDYRDINGINTVLLRIGDIALLASLDDAKLSSHFLSGHIGEVKGKPMSPIQLREMLAHLSFVSGNLIERPLFRNEYEIESRQSTIKSAIPERKELIQLTCPL